MLSDDFYAIPQAIFNFDITYHSQFFFGKVNFELIMERDVFRVSLRHILRYLFQTLNLHAAAHYNIEFIFIICDIEGALF